MTKPAHKDNDGRISYAIWKQEALTDNGEVVTFPSTTFQRVYTDKATGKTKNADSYTGSELLVLSQLALEAYKAERKLRVAWKIQPSAERTPSDSGTVQ